MLFDGFWLLLSEEIVVAGGTEAGVGFETIGIDDSVTALTAMPASPAAQLAGFAIPFEAVAAARVVADVATAETVITEIQATVLAIMQIIRRGAAFAVSAADAVPILQADVRGFCVVLMQNSMNGEEGIADSSIAQCLGD